jgi:hypothetical protein
MLNRLRLLWSKKWLRIAALVLATLMALATFDYWTYPLLSSAPTQRFAKGSDGIWIRYKWYFGEVDEKHVTNHSKWLQDNGFRYAFFHVRSAGKSGGLLHDYMDRATKLNDTVRSAAPDLVRIAWLYVGNEAGSGSVDLSTPGTKEALVQTASRLIDEGGFDGIQWDYEICPDGDKDFLELLRMSREALPASTFTSVCAPSNYGWPLAGFGWSERYFHEVAQLTDQIALMLYDTGMVMPRMYASHVALQTRALGEATKGTDCKVLFGLASYGQGFRSHNPRAENLRIGIRALRSALERSNSNNFEGLSIFADYTTDQDEWQQYLKNWR